MATLRNKYTIRRMRLLNTNIMPTSGSSNQPNQYISYRRMTKRHHILMNSLSSLQQNIRRYNTFSGNINHPRIKLRRPKVRKHPRRRKATHARMIQTPRVNRPDNLHISYYDHPINRIRSSLARHNPLLMPKIRINQISRTNNHRTLPSIHATIQHKTRSTRRLTIRRIIVSNSTVRSSQILLLRRHRRRHSSRPRRQRRR